MPRKRSDLRDDSQPALCTSRALTPDERITRGSCLVEATRPHPKPRVRKERKGQSRRDAFTLRTLSYLPYAPCGTTINRLAKALYPHQKRTNTQRLHVVHALEYIQARYNVELEHLPWGETRELEYWVHPRSHDRADRLVRHRLDAELARQNKPKTPKKEVA